MVGPLVLATLSSCASFNPARDKLAIDHLLTERGAGDLGWDQNGSVGADETVKGWLGQPLTRDNAIKIAMLKSPRLQQVYGELGLARADVMDAVQISNPRIGVSSLALENGPGSQFVIGVAQPLIDLLTLPLKSRLAHLNYERSRYETAAAILGVSLDVESAWYRNIAAQQVADMRAAVADALQTSADLAQRFYDAGNITELQLNREKAAASEARIGATRAAVAAKIARLELNNLLGLSGVDADWKSPPLLSLPVSTEDDPGELRRIAQASSLDLLAARKGEVVAAGAARFSRQFRLLGTTTIGYDREREVDGTVIKGPRLDLELPIFNQNGARVVRSEAQLRLARARLAALELNAANTIPAAAERVHVLSDVVAIYRTALVPERETVARQSQLEQNFALIGEFEVLAARAQQYDAYQGFLEAVRDYWLARVDLMRLIGSRLPSDASPVQPTRSVQEYLAPPTDMMGMAGMTGHQHGGSPTPDGAPGQSDPGTMPSGHQHSMHDMPGGGAGAPAGTPGGSAPSAPETAPMHHDHMALPPTPDVTPPESSMHDHHAGAMPPAEAPPAAVPAPEPGANPPHQHHDATPADAGHTQHEQEAPKP